MRTTLQGSALDANKRVRKAIVRAVAKTCYNARTKGKTGGKRNAARIPYGMVAKLVDGQNKQKRDLGLTASMIHSVVRNMVKKQSEKSKSDPESDTDPESDSDDDSGSLKKKGKPGRPKGTTRDNITSKMKKEKDFINTVSSSYQQIRKLNPKKKLDRGQFNLLVADLKQEHAMPADFEINFGSIRKRFLRGNPTSYGKGPNSPSRHLEAALVDLLLLLADMNKPLTCGEGVKLANEMIKDTDLQGKIIEFKKKLSHHCDENGRNSDGLVLGSAWWRAFMKRHGDQLTSAKGRKFSLNREQWVTYDNFLNMYKCIYEEMVDAGVAEELEIPVYMDAEGNSVDVEAAYGRKCTHRLVHPSMCFVFDETGGNTCMVGDGHVGGRRYVTRRGMQPKLRASANDNHFTTLTVTALTGEPVLCVVIFKGKIAC